MNQLYFFTGGKKPFLVKTRPFPSSGHAASLEDGFSFVSEGRNLGNAKTKILKSIWKTFIHSPRHPPLWFVGRTRQYYTVYCWISLFLERLCRTGPRNTGNLDFASRRQTCFAESAVSKKSAKKLGQKGKSLFKPSFSQTFWGAEMTTNAITDNVPIVSKILIAGGIFYLGIFCNFFLRFPGG